MPKLSRLSCLANLTLVSILLAASASAAEISCDLPSSPGASLLLPYFEVDLEEQFGRSTLFAVGSVAEQTVLARATMWTNWGHPVMAFDFAIEAGAVRTFNVRDLLNGQLPATEPPEVDEDGRYLGCRNPVVLPLVDAEGLRHLLTGGARASDGLCYAESVEDGRLATGYVTVDAVNDCSLRNGPTPLDDGYFGDCASGLASNDNVLWGDFFLVDSTGNHAQGERLVVVSADQTRFGSDVCVDPPCGIRNPTSFYHPQGNRMPLPAAYEARFLNGGDFDGGTELLLWVKGQIGPATCNSTNRPGGAPIIRFAARTERGVSLGTSVFETRRLALRLKVGGDDLPLPANFGALEISAAASEQGADRQLWTMSLMSAEQRFGVGLGAAPVRDFCN